MQSETTNIALDKFCEKHSIPLYDIVYKDQLSDIDIHDLVAHSRSPGCAIIINMADESPGEGTHWVCLWIRANDVLYFDSFGFPPPVNVENFYSRLSSVIHMNPLLVNSKQIQNINSGFCGEYCLFFLWFCSRHPKWSGPNLLRYFQNVFDSDVEDNLKILKNVFLHKI